MDQEATKRRARAALAMGGYGSVEDLAAALAERDSGIGLRRLRTIWQTGESRAVERREIAAACDVPAWFMEEGFAGRPAERASVDDRVDALEQQMATVLRLLATRGERGSGESPQERHGGQ